MSKVEIYKPSVGGRLDAAGGHTVAAVADATGRVVRFVGKVMLACVAIGVVLGGVLVWNAMSWKSGTPARVVNFSPDKNYSDFPAQAPVVQNRQGPHPICRTVRVYDGDIYVDPNNGNRYQC